jgi:hypothetical protein
MTSKHEKDNRRKQKLRERADAKRKRTVIVRDGDQRSVIKQGNNKGYPVQMIRDFLDHLLLEVRTQHYENQRALKALGSTDDLKSAMKLIEQSSEKLENQFLTYQERYQSALIARHVIDGKDVPEAVYKAAIVAVAKGMLAKRDEQIGHMEALQDLFKEALYCATLPFGVDGEGNPIQPEIFHKAREMADQAFMAALPDYEALLPMFSDHDFSTPAGVQLLRNHHRSHVIVAVNDAYEQPLVLYNGELVDQLRAKGSSQVPIVPIPVASFHELQFVIAAIAKFIGRPCTDGEPWKDL